MKKLFVLMLCLAAILTIGTITASAEAVDQAGFWVQDSAKAEEVLAGEAGERDIAWEVPFLHIAPTLDGTIDKSEYIPFELYEDYMAWMANHTDANTGEVANTEEEFQLFYEAAQEGFFKPYWGWDGTYLYMAFEVNLINGFKCTPEEKGGDMFLWAYNCLQVGLANVDASGRDPSYVELGFGVHSVKNEPITANWAGTYLPKAGEDFVGYYDETNQVLVYELRIHLQTALGLTDRVVENGDQINYAWLLSVNGESEGPNDTWQLAFCHGIGGPYSGKETRYFARVTFTGKPAGLDIPPVDIPGMSEEDKEFGLREFIDMNDENIVSTFEGENAGIEYITEGEESFMRITSLTNTDYPYVFSTKYPTNLVGGLGDYIVVKYRTSSPEGSDLGIIFRTIYAQEHDPENCYVDTIGTDGEWHTMIFYMTGEASWNHFILNLGLVPFAYSDKSAQETIDIAWIKIYQNDPTDLYLDDMYDPDAGETEAPTEAPTDAPAVTETPTEAPTKAPAVTEAPTEAPKDEQKKGCGAVMGSVAVILTAAAAAVVLKKKED
ncbi:MAG: PT domain-containing protein [Clostridia bacterium]|nr:PT domain-containing protein [Clostridia bacterium]